IRAAIEEFFATGVVDEIVVVNNNAAPGTAEEVARTAARQVFELRQGYGAAIRRGLQEATGDYLIIAEPDGTFAGSDVRKLLAYAEDFDVVFGTRTTSSLIGEGANMGLFLKWGNWAVAKLFEVLFDTTHFSDVGCTMRLIKREALARISPHFTVDGSHFGLEMMVLVVTSGLSYIEIPVHYRARVGTSSVTGDPVKAVLLGLRMILFLFERRLRLARPPSPRLAILLPLALVVVFALSAEGLRWLGPLARRLGKRSA
ncbi:MAG: glycosyltransferase family 2 protein, partial [Chloroflexi bacterium]|nr:glycosyltransferase family 2 protein [Chloroflexota bacterium]